MRTLHLSEIPTVHGGGQPNADPAGNFSGSSGCPAGYSGVTLVTTTSTYQNGVGLSTKGGAEGAVSGTSTTVTAAPPTVTTSVQSVCLPNLPAGGSSASGSADSGGSAAGAAGAGGGGGGGGGAGGSKVEDKEREDDE